MTEQTWEYGALAGCYDRFFGTGPMRGPAAAARERLLAEIWPEVKTGCDLACGTGTTALELARKGIRMYAVDLSAAMCRLTREKARREGAAVKVMQTDMRSFSLPKRVDLVTCEYDSVNHLPRRLDIARLARRAAAALRAGGWFVFDVNTLAAFELVWNGVVWLETQDVAMAMRNGHDMKAGRAWCDLEIFERAGKLWRRKRERVEEICWEETEIRRALTGAGFDRVRAVDAVKLLPATPYLKEGCRTFWVARKGGGGRG